MIFPSFSCFFHQYFKISLGCYLRFPSNTGFDGDLGQFRVEYQILSTSALPLPRLPVLIKDCQPFSHLCHLVSETLLLKITSSTPNEFLFSTHKLLVHDK